MVHAKCMWPCLDHGWSLQAAPGWLPRPRPRLDWRPHLPRQQEADPPPRLLWRPQGCLQVRSGFLQLHSHCSVCTILLKKPPSQVCALTGVRKSYSIQASCHHVVCMRSCFITLAQSCSARPPASGAPAVAPAVAPAAAPTVAPAPVSAAVPAAAPALPRAAAAGSAENAASTAPGAAAPGSPAMGLRDEPMACPSDSLACGAGAAVASATLSAGRVELELSVRFGGPAAAGNEADGAAR